MASDWTITLLCEISPREETVQSSKLDKCGRNADGRPSAGTPAEYVWHQPLSSGLPRCFGAELPAQSQAASAEEMLKLPTAKLDS